MTIANGVSKMDEWHVGDPPDWGDSVGVPDIPYMGYMNGDEDDDDWQPPRRPKKTQAQIITDEAWQLRQQGRYLEALDTIKRALAADDTDPECYNVRAIIHEDLENYEDALIYYNRSLDMQFSQVVTNNKARLLEKIAKCERQHSFEKALKYINEALKITDDDEDRKRFLITKGDILESMGMEKEGFICFLLAADLYDKVDNVEKQAKILENTNDTIICIAGTRFYHDHKLLNDGETVEIIREPENEDDPDAIRVEIEGKTAGYVANSSRTLVGKVKSASEIKDIIKENQKARIMFTYIDRYVIAKLI